MDFMLGGGCGNSVSLQLRDRRTHRREHFDDLGGGIVVFAAHGERFNRREAAAAPSITLSNASGEKLAVFLIRMLLERRGRCHLTQYVVGNLIGDGTVRKSFHDH